MYFQSKEAMHSVVNSQPPFQSARPTPPAPYSTHKNYLGLPQLSIPQAGPKAVLNRQSSYPDSPISATSPALSSRDELAKINFREEPGMMGDGVGDPIWKRFSKEKEGAEERNALNSSWLESEKKSSKKLTLIGIISLVIILGIVGGIVAWRLTTKSSGPSNTQPIVPYLGGFNGVNSSTSPIFQSDTALAAVLPPRTVQSTSTMAQVATTSRAVVTARITPIPVSTTSLIPTSTRRAAARRHRRV